MLHSKQAHHAIAFGLITIAAVALYPAANEKKVFLTWVLLAVIGAAAILTLLRR